MEQQIVFLLSNLATHKFGMLKVGDSPVIDNIYNFLRECAEKENVLIKFGGNPFPAEKFYLRYQGLIFIFTKILAEPPYFWFEKIEDTNWPMLEFNE